MGRTLEPLCRIRDILRAISEFESEFQSRYGIGLNEGMLLCSISTHGQCSSGKVAELLGVTNSNASKIIASAEKKGLIERIICKEDKRQMHFTLTDNSIDLIKRIKSEPEQMLNMIEYIKNI